MLEIYINIVIKSIWFEAGCLHELLICMDNKIFFKSRKVEVKPIQPKIGWQINPYQLSFIRIGIQPQAGWAY